MTRELKNIEASIKREDYTMSPKNGRSSSGFTSSQIIEEVTKIEMEDIRKMIS
jgi:hypothetical protein